MRLMFLQYILRKVNSLNIEFQSEHFRLHRLHLMVVSEYTNILGCFVKESVLQGIKVADIDPTNKYYHKTIENIYLGGSAMAQLIHHPLPSNTLKRFKQDCLKFLVELCVQIRKKFPLNEDSVISKLNVLDPNIASNVSLSPPSLTHLSSIFPNLVPPTQVEQLDDQWRSFRLTAKDLHISSVDHLPVISNPKFALLSDFMTNLAYHIRQLVWNVYFHK